MENAVFIALLFFFLQLRILFCRVKNPTATQEKAIADFGICKILFYASLLAYVRF